MRPQVRRSKPESQVPRPVTCRVGGECNRLSQPPSLQAPRLTHCCRPLKLPFRTQRRRRCGRPVISLIGRSGASSAEGQPLLTDLVDDMAPTKMRRSEGRHQSVLYITFKAKHSKTETFQVAGWRPSTSSRPGGLILAEDDEPIAVAALAIPDKDTTGSRRPAAPLRSPSPHRPVTIPDSCLTATVRYTSRTPTHGHLREAFVLAVQPAGQVPMFRPAVGQTETRPERRRLGTGDVRDSGGRCP